MVPRFLVPVLLFLTSPLLAAIHGGTERELMPREIDVAASEQSGRIATDGVSFLSVWIDASSGDSRILGARLAENGAVVDTTPLTISAAASNDVEPDVAWGRDRYLAVWLSDNQRIRGRFVTSVGTMSNPIEIATRATPGGNSSLQVVFNGRMFLVAWFEFDAVSSRYHAAIIDLDGRVVAARSVLPASSYGFHLAAFAGTFYFFHVDGQRILATLIDDAANPGTTLLIEDSPYPAGGIRTATRGGEMLIGWTGSSPDKYIQTVRFTTAGAQERAAFDTGAFSLQDVVADASGYLLFYGNSNSVRARRLGSGSETIVAPPPQAATLDSAASNGSRTVALISAGGSLWTSVIGDDRVAPLVVAPRNQTVPDIATAGDRKLVVWAEDRTAEHRVIVAAARVDANGTLLDAQPIEIGTFTTYEPRHPLVASNGTDWLVIWHSNGNIVGRRIRRNGTFIDAAPLILGSYAFTLVAYGPANAAVAWDGTSYVVVYSSGSVGRFTSVRTFITRVPPSGDPAPTFPISDAGPNFSPVIAAGPNASLIVWTANYQLHGVLLSHSDAITPVVFPAGFGGPPSVAWNRDAFMVAVDALTFLGSVSELRWARVDAFGNVLESFSSINIGTATLLPRVLPFGDHFLLLWLQQNLFGAILDRNGNLIEGPATIAENIQSFSADGAQLVTSHAIAHPTRPARVFLQNVEWTPENAVRQRSVRH